jgi:hypothetical protein
VPQGAEVRKERPRNCPVGTVRFVIFLRVRRHESEVVDFEGLNCKMWATYHIRIGVLLVNIEIDYHFVRKQLINKLPDTKFISSKD